MGAGCMSEFLSLCLGGIIGMQLPHWALLQGFSCLGKVSGVFSVVPQEEQPWWPISCVVAREEHRFVSLNALSWPVTPRLSSVATGAHTHWCGGCWLRTLSSSFVSQPFSKRGLSGLLQLNSCCLNDVFLIHLRADLVSQMCSDFLTAISTRALDPHRPPHKMKNFNYKY